MHCSNLLPPPTLQIYMTGTSAGGMMVEHLLCSSALIPNTIAAAVDIIGGAGTPLRDSCNPAVKVPLRILHGEEDPVLHFNESTEVDGSPFMSTSERGGLSCESVRVCTLCRRGSPKLLPNSSSPPSHPSRGHGCDVEGPLWLRRRRRPAGL